VGTDGDNYVEFWVQNGFVGFGRAIDDTYQSVGPNVVLGYPDVHWLRFREADGTIFFETSNDGVDFDVVAETLAVFDVRHTHVNVGAEGDGLGMSGLIRIDSITGGPTPGSLCKTASLSDDFDDGQRDPAWEDWEDDFCDIDESGGGQLVVDVAAGADGDDCGYKATHAFDFTGSKASIEVVDLPTGAEMWLHVSDPDEENGVGFFVDDGTMFVVSLVDEDDTDLASLPFDGQAHRFLQLREAGGEVFWEVSADGQSWTEVHAAPVAIALNRMSLYIGAGASGLVPPTIPLSISLDNFNITR
jgi:hypothetical protein